MRQIVTAALVVVFCVTASPAGELTQQDRKSPAQSPEAARQYKALLKGYEEEEDAREFAERFLQLALKHPRDVVAIDSLSWIAVHVLRGPELGRALVRLKQQHLSSNKLAAVCEALERKSSTAAEQLLRGTLAKSPHRTVRTQACFSLARFLERKMTLSSKLAERPELKPRFEQFYGKDFTRLLVKLKPSATGRETERLYTGRWRQGLQAVRLPRQGGGRRFLGSLVRPLPGPVPARAVARETTGRKAVRLAGGQQRRGSQGAQDGDRQGEDRLAELV